MFKQTLIKRILSFPQIGFLSLFLSLSVDAFEEETDKIPSPFISYSGNTSSLSLGDPILTKEEFENLLFTKEEIEFLMEDQEDQSSIPSSFTLSECKEILDSEKNFEELRESTQIYTDTLKSIQPVKNLLLAEGQEMSFSPSSAKIIIHYLNPFPLIIRNSDVLPQTINPFLYPSQRMPSDSGLENPLPSFLAGEGSSAPSSVFYPLVPTRNISPPEPSSLPLPKAALKKHEVLLKKPVKYTFIKETPMIKKSRKKKERKEWKFHDYSEKKFC